MTVMPVGIFLNLNGMSFSQLDDKSSINVMHIYCRSLKTNFNSVKNLLDMISNPLTAIAVTETWLTDYLHDVYNIPGYNFISKPRVEKGGGGVGIVINRNLDYTVRRDLCRMESYLECLFIDHPNRKIKYYYWFNLSPAKN